jgi:hypothetical protein
MPEHRWCIYAGASLRSADIEPIQVMLDDEGAQALHEGDRAAWSVLIAAVGIYLEQ